MSRNLNRLLKVALIVAIIGAAALWIERRETEPPGEDRNRTEQKIEKKIVTQEMVKTSSTAAESAAPASQDLLQAAESPAFRNFVVNQPSGPGSIAQFFKSEGLGQQYAEYLNLFTKMFQDQFPGEEAAALEPYMRETLARIAAEIKASSEGEVSQETFFQDVLVTFLVEEQNTPWMMTYFEGDFFQAAIWAKSVLQNPLPPLADTTVPTPPAPAPREITASEPQAEPPADSTPLPDAVSHAREDLTSEVETGVPDDLTQFELPTQEDFENVLRDEFTPDRFQRAMRTLEQHGPTEGLHKLKESDPEIAKQFERFIQGGQVQ